MFMGLEPEHPSSMGKRKARGSLGCWKSDLVLGDASDRIPSLVNLDGALESARFPDEIWDLILEDASPHDLQALSSSCKYLRSVALPRLFRRFCVTLPGVEIKILRRLRRRFNFYASKPIHELVKECKLKSFHDLDYLSGCPVEDATFEYLPRLPNLMALSCEFIRITPRRAAVLRNLTSKSLVSITLKHCVVDPEVKALPPSLQTLSISYPTIPSTPFDQTYTSLLCPATLQSLAVELTTLPLVPHGIAYKSLRNLTFNGSNDTLRTSISFFAHCPMLKTLALNLVFDEEMLTLPEETSFNLPHLTSYTGFAAFLPFLASTASLRKLNLCVPADFRIMPGVLRHLALQSTDLRELSLSPMFLTRSLLRSIAGFPRLRELEITTRPNDVTMRPRDLVEHVKELLYELRMLSLPPSIERLYINSHLPHRTSNDVGLQSAWIAMCEESPETVRSHLAQIFNPDNCARLRYAAVFAEGFFLVIRS